MNKLLAQVMLPPSKLILEVERIIPSDTPQILTNAYFIRAPHFGELLWKMSRALWLVKLWLAVLRC